MPFRESIGKLVDRLDRKAARTPPPVPHATKPQNYPAGGGGASQAAAYWAPTFHPSKAVSDDFSHETGQSGWGNAELQNYTASGANSFFTPAGQLVLRAVARSGAPTQEERYTSARLTTRRTLARQRGCLEVRLTAPCARGVWPAFWMLPAEPFRWPEEGEVDVFESWNGEATNHSCLHWGNYDGRDWDRHRVVETPVHGLADPRGMLYAFAWEQPEDGAGGRMVWYIDGRPVMRAGIPAGTRRMSDWRIIINVAMGGNVCQGAVPADGVYNLAIHSIRMLDAPQAGWEGFESHWKSTKEGHTL